MLPGTPLDPGALGRAMGAPVQGRRAPVEDQEARREPPGAVESPRATEQAAPPEMDPGTAEEILAELKESQNFPLAIVAGAVAALAGAGIWAIITAVTNYQIGWMAVGVGVLVGMAVRRAGKGLDRSFGIAGAVLSLLGCLLGNALTVYYFAAKQIEEPFLKVLTNLPFSEVLQEMKRGFSAFDLLFYAIAVYEGYRFSFRQFTQEDLASLSKQA